MKKLAVLMFVLAMCAPSFAARKADDVNMILVYKVSMSDSRTGIDVCNVVANTINLDTIGSVKPSSFKGYLVVEVNVATLVTVAVDPNGVTSHRAYDPCLILIGKDPTSTAKTKVKWIFDNGDVDISRTRLGTGAKAQTWGNLEWYNFESTTDDTYQSEGDVSGKLVGVALVKGDKTKYQVPKSLKDDGEFGRFFPHGAAFDADGRAILTLDLKTTQAANENGGTTVTAVIDQLLPTLK
jgi:hypothetical protein